MTEAKKPRSRLLDPWVIAGIISIVALTLSRPCFVREPPPPPIGVQLPAFSLVDQHAKVFGTEQLAGRTWVGALLPVEPGPKAARAFEGLLRLQEAWEREGRELVIVAIGVEPERQTPEQLRALGMERGADFARLKFLTGDADSTCDAVTGFLHDARLSSCDRLLELAERGRLLLVDSDGRARGLYRADTLGVEEVHFRALTVAGAE